MMSSPTKPEPVEQEIDEGSCIVVGVDASPETATRLGVRRMPVRPRGHAAFERILDTTAALLEEVGIESVTTNLIAERSGANIATVYKYFPNKHAIIAELFHRMREERARIASHTLAGLHDAADWRAQVALAIEESCQLRRHRTGVLALRKAMRASPELQQLDQDQSQSLTDILAVEIAAVAERMPRAQARIIARCCMEAANALLDLWNDAMPSEAERIRAQIDALVVGYLAPYFDSPKRAPPP